MQSSQNKLISEYQRCCNTKTDINQHLPTLKSYAEKCKHITEFGVSAANSTTALLCGYPQIMRSYDIQTIEDLSQIGNLVLLLEIAKNINVDFKFQTASSIEISIEPTELLFIDTWHVYQQLAAELKLHENNVSKYILIHDTETFKYHDIRINHKNKDSEKRGLMTAVEEFVSIYPAWEIIEHYTNNNGLTILERQYA